MNDIEVDEFLAILNAKDTTYKILDVREELEYHTYNIGGTNIPLGKIERLLEDDDFEFEPNENIIVICQRGIRSKTAKTILNQKGYLKVKNLNGGLLKLQRLL